MLLQIHDMRNFHQTVPDDIDAIARVAFVKNLLPGGKLPFLRDAAQALPFAGIQPLKKSHRFQLGHNGTLWKSLAA